MVNKFCFVAVVRDESPVIERCLESVRNIATSYLICDTGSKDDTAEKIEQYMQKAQIPGEVIHTEWVSYGETKSYLLEKFREHPVVGDAKYICWLDADEVFIMQKNNPLSYPTQEDADTLYEYLNTRSENIFRLTSVYGQLNYWRWQIARNDQLYKWCLPYQEYFTGTEYSKNHDVDFMYNLARHEGNSSRDPEIMKKRIKMSENWLERNAKDPKDSDYTRMLFYLAEAYSSLEGADENGKTYKQKAIETYQDRLNAMGFYQEKYISMLRMAKLVPTHEKLALYWRAIDYIPERLEAIYHLMMHYYNKGDHVKAAAIGGLAPESRIPPSNALFTNIEVYNYRFDMNWSVSCHFSGDHEKALKIGLKLLQRNTIPEGSNKKIAQKNIRFFQEKIPKRIPVKLGPNTAPRSDLDMPLPIVFVIDNFYEDPDAIRAKALQMDFNVKGNFPGFRSASTATNEHKSIFEKIVGRKITYWPDSYNGSYQYTLAKNKSWIHRDKTDFSAVIYLTPNPPIDGGTCLWRHKKTQLERTTTESQEKQLNSDGNDESRWELLDRIGNKYNRAIIFQGFLSHKSDQYFGDSLETARLFQTFFFNVEGRKF